MDGTERDGFSKLLKKAGLPEFSMGEDGFPVPGQVIRCYREQMVYTDRCDKVRCWTQADLARRLNLSELSVRYMETRNTGLDSIERRRVLASLLKIPPALLGLSSLEDLPENFDKYIQAPTNVQNSHGKNVGNVQLYRDAFTVYSLQHNTYTAQDALLDIEQWITRIQADLSGVQSQQQAELSSILWNFHALSAKIYGEDLCQWKPAFEHLNASLEIATALNNCDLQASSLYRSGAVYVARKNLALAKSSIDGALSYMKKAQDHIKGAVCVDAALIYASTSTDMGGVTYAHRLLDQAELYISKPVNDGVMNFSVGKYHLIKARTLIALNRPGKALECLEDAQSDITPNERRRLAFLDIMWAECYTKMKRAEYDKAVNLLMEALITSKAIKSTFNITHISRLYKIVSESAYGNSPEIADLGMQLGKLQMKPGN